MCPTIIYCCYCLLLLVCYQIHEFTFYFIPWVWYIWKVELYVPSLYCWPIYLVAFLSGSNGAVSTNVVTIILYFLFMNLCFIPLMILVTSDFNPILTVDWNTNWCQELLTKHTWQVRWIFWKPLVGVQELSHKGDMRPCSVESCLSR